MRDTIEEEDLYLDTSKNELEKQIQDKGNKIELLQDQLKNQDEMIQGMRDILKLVEMDKLLGKKKTVTQTPKWTEEL